MKNRYTAFTLREVETFLSNLPPKEEARIRADILTTESGDFTSLYIKTLRGSIKELVEGPYRILFFITAERIIYFTNAFRKKSRKTPPQEILKAEQIYKLAIAEYNERIQKN